MIKPLHIFCATVTITVFSITLFIGPDTAATGTSYPGHNTTHPTPAPELIDKRSYNQQVFDQGNGTFQAKIHAGHINYYDSKDDQFLPIDTTLTKTPEGYTMDQASYHLRLPRFADEPFDFINNYQDNGQETVTLTALNTSHVPGHIVTDPQDRWAAKAVSYPNAFGNHTDLLLRARNTGFDKLVVINQKPKSLSRDLEFSFALDFGDYHFKDFRGEPIDPTHFPYETEKALIIENLKQTWFRDFKMWDSSSPSKSVPIKIRLEKVGASYRLTKILDKTWLSQATYPVFTDATASYYSGAGDGAIYTDASTWDAVHDATTGDGANYTNTDMDIWTNWNGASYYGIERVFIPIDTSALDDDVTITSASLYLYPYSKTVDDNDGDDFFTVVQTSQPSNTSLTTADFDLCGSIDSPTEGIDSGNRVDLSDLTINQYVSLSLNSTGIGWISKTGYTKLGIREGHDVVDSTTIGNNSVAFYSSEQTGTDNDPYLFVEYTEPEPTPTPTPAPTSAPESKTFTVALWVNPTTGIASKALAVKQNEIRLVTDGDGKPLCQFHNGTDWQTAATASTALSLSTWQHIACSYDLAQLRVFVNGNQVGSQAINRSLLVDTSNPWRFGSDAGGTYNDYSGTLDEARIYNRALSPTEVQKLYNWAPGPVGYWKMDEGTGTTAYDSSGNNNTGTLNSMPTSPWIKGKYGSALNFEGTDDRVDAGSADILDNLPAITLSFWMYPKCVNEWESPISKADSGSSYLGWVTSIWCTQNRMSFLVGYDSQSLQKEMASNSITRNQWQHVSITWDGTSNTSGVRMYVNGIETSYNGAGTNGSSTRNTDAAQTLYLGNVTGFAEDFNGYLDDVKIYNYTRTPAQIIEDMNAGHPAPGSPVGSAYIHYKFDDGYGSTAFNSGNGGSGLDGLITSGAWTNSGKFGKALTFTASTSVTDTITDLNYIHTTSLWVYPTTSAASKTLVTTLLTTDTSSRPVHGGCTGTALSLNTWTHIVAVSNGSGSCAIYQNGIRTASGTTGVDSGTSLNIGATSFTGNIDEFKLYNLAMTSDQVKTEYAGGFAAVWGATSTDSSGTASNASVNEYCPPGQTTDCVGPVAEWKFDENTGTSAFDSSGNGNTGTLTNGPTWATGKSGSALSFDGSDDYVAVTSGSSIEDIYNGGGTVSAWIYPASDGEGDQGRIVEKWPSGGGWTFFVRNQSGSFIDVWFSYNFSTTNGAWYASSFPVNVWSHVTITYDRGSSTNIPDIYRNGVKLNVTTDTAASGTSLADSGSSMYIGNRSTPDRTFDGLIDDIRIYNYVRTPAQIAWDYNRGGPVGWWKMNEGYASGTGNTMYDSSGFGNNGTTNWGANSSGMDCTVAGKQGKACDFDGSDDYINIGDLNETANNFSISAWVNPSALDTSNTIYAKNESSTQEEIMLGVDIGGTVSFFTPDSSSCTNAWNYIGTTTTLSIGSWHHVVAVYDDDNNQKLLYLDGKLENSTSDTVNLPDCGIDGKIGLSQRGPTYFYGKIDEFKIFNYALTAEQVKLEYNQGAVNFSN